KRRALEACGVTSPHGTSAFRAARLGPGGARGTVATPTRLASSSRCRSLLGCDSGPGVVQQGANQLRIRLGEPDAERAVASRPTSVLDKDLAVGGEKVEAAIDRVDRYHHLGAIRAHRREDLLSDTKRRAFEVRLFVCAGHRERQFAEGSGVHSS